MLYLHFWVEQPLDALLHAACCLLHARIVCLFPLFFCLKAAFKDFYRMAFLIICISTPRGVQQLHQELQQE